MDWSPNPLPELLAPRGPGWSGTGPAAPPIPAPEGVSWRPKQQGTGTSVSYAEFEAALRIYLTALSAATGVHTATLAAHLTALMSSRTIGSAEGEYIDNTLKAKLTAWTIAASQTTARAAFSAKGTVDALAVFTATIQAHLVALSTAQATTTAALLAHLSGVSSGAGSASATAGFGAWGPATTTFSTVGTFNYPIPPASLYLDLIGVGSGAGGEGGGLAVPGKGGGAGQLVTRRLVRGVDIPWDLASLTVVIPNGGTGGAGGAFPARGGNGSAVTIGSYLTAPGGVNYASSNSTGLSPGSVQFQGTTYTGGGQQTSQEGNGNAPGGGAAGGRALVFTGTKGGKGAPGGAWIKAGH